MKELLKVFITTINLIFACSLFSQNVGIGQSSFTPNSSAGLDIDFSNKGLLIPRVALSSVNSNAPIGNGIATSLIVYNTDSAGTFPYQVIPGIYFWNGVRWKAMGNNWHKSGNVGTNPNVDFIGTLDTQNLVFKVNNEMAGLIDQSATNNTFFGYMAGSNITSDGESNAFFGFHTGLNTDIGIRNSAIGAFSLYSNFAGSFNSSNGCYALYNNQGDENCANGYGALYMNSYGTQNTANGTYALNNNSYGSYNTADGYAALSTNTMGEYNTALGHSTLVINQTGSHNVAVGYNALFHYLYSGNTAVGDGALNTNTDDGSGGDAYNTAVGFEAMNKVTTGSNNVGSGYRVLFANTTGNNNVGLGNFAGFSDAAGSGNVFIGNMAGYNETGSNRLYIANSNTATPLIGGDFSAGVVTVNSVLRLSPSSVPANPVAGMLYFDSSTNKLRCYDGASWHNIW